MRKQESQAPSRILAWWLGECDPLAKTGTEDGEQVWGKEDEVSVGHGESNRVQLVVALRDWGSGERAGPRALQLCSCCSLLLFLFPLAGLLPHIPLPAPSTYAHTHHHRQPSPAVHTLWMLSVLSFKAFPVSGLWALFWRGANLTLLPTPAPLLILSQADCTYEEEVFLQESKQTISMGCFLILHLLRCPAAKLSTLQWHLPVFRIKPKLLTVALKPFVTGPLATSPTLTLSLLPPSPDFCSWN